jgi:hypothetical protein
VEEMVWVAAEDNHFVFSLKSLEADGALGAYVRVRIKHFDVFSKWCLFKLVYVLVNSACIEVDLELFNVSLEVQNVAQECFSQSGNVGHHRRLVL